MCQACWQKCLHVKVLVFENNIHHFSRHTSCALHAALRRPLVSSLGPSCLKLVESRLGLLGSFPRFLFGGGGGACAWEAKSTRARVPKTSVDVFRTPRGLSARYGPAAQPFEARATPSESLTRRLCNALTFVPFGAVSATFCSVPSDRRFGQFFRKEFRVLVG
jgi:hypothetical protein